VELVVNCVAFSGCVHKAGHAHHVKKIKMIKSIFVVFIFFIDIVLFITLFVYMIKGNIKAKKLIEILPKEKLDSLKFGLGYNNFKVCKYIMSDDISDTQDIIEDGSSRVISWKMKGFNEVKADRTEPQCGCAQVLLFKSSVFRSFYGQGAMAFIDGQMSISAKLGPNEMIIWGIIVLVQLIGLASLYYGSIGIIFGGLVLAALESVFVKVFSKRHTIKATPQDMESLHRNGPFITLRFKNAIVPGLRKVKFYVSKKFRDDFAHDFDRTFPRLLK